jgi:hypothetical protein
VCHKANKENFLLSERAVHYEIVLQLDASLLQMKFADFGHFGKNIVSFEDTFSILEGI